MLKDNVKIQICIIKHKIQNADMYFRFSVLEYIFVLWNIESGIHIIDYMIQNIICITKIYFRM